MRATLAILAVACVPLGGAIPGFVTAVLVPTHGWQILFYIGGIAPIVIALVAWMGLPESIKYMALHESQRGKMEATIKSIQPGYAIPANAKFVIEDEKQFPGFNPAYLFHDGLALITPLVWLLFALNLMGYFFLISWTPILMTAAKLPPATAALSGALLQVGGTVAAIGLCWWFQRHRFLALAVLFACAVPVVASIGYAGLTSPTALLVATFFAGFLVLGIQTGLNGVGALIYPTSLRANGSGWQLGIGRIGSIVGPLAGAVLILWPVEHLYLWGAVPFLAAAVICFIVHRLNTARLAANPELRKAQ
jgi:AAHS family 4-hydroxybenzoate transporter-like MFS transporter